MELQGTSQKGARAKPIKANNGAEARRLNLQNGPERNTDSRQFTNLAGLVTRSRIAADRIFQFIWTAVLL